MADPSIPEPPTSAAPAQSADPTPITKSAEKKLAKKKENEARLALKAAKAAKAAATAPVGEKKAKKEKEKEEEAPFVNSTPKGDKKDLSQPMASGYNPIAVEAAWYDWWDAQGYFAPQLTQDGNVKPEGLFVIPSPPPNVTGSLHIGHALTVAIQDSLVRWNRMLGKTTLFVPGFDHAGISTQSVVEKRLYKTGKTRHDLGREKFTEKVWEWKEDYQSRITNQLRRLGGSYDWNRVAFTMNEQLSKAVVETFCRLHEEGIIYRANRLVNWCVQLNTTLSNLEVEQKQLEGRTLLNVPGYDIKEKFEFGVITSFAYPIEGSDEKIIVATTRPETMLGDTAIAVHPEDSRYKHLHGKFAKHPFLDRRIPIVTDDIAVDMSFGTGAVKITPAHDPNDYEMGLRHNLPFINILNDDGTFNENAGPKFAGMRRFHARVAVVQALKDAGLYVETKDNPMQIPICSKSGDVIEPILKPQWWVDCKPLAKEALERTRAGELEISPKASEAEWYRWLEGIQDWCISRQLWWGHRCPAYFVNIEGQDQDRNDGKHWVVGRTLEEATAKAKKLAGVTQFTLEQDEDVLDTWFSSGLWPFSIMGWPDNTNDFKNFYPTSILETGWDILFFWVARMVFLGTHLTGKMPFSEVYCHAMIRDAHGRKMSKSLGNVIDPIDVIQGLDLEALHQKLYEGNLDEREIQKAKAGQKKDFPKGIPQCGTDALRFALCAYSGGGRDINLEILRVEGYRKFCNKIFNATKFAMLKLDDKFVPEPTPKPTGNESLVEKWILHKLNQAADEINKQLTDRNFMNATGAAYNFWLYELCDVYIEAMKPMSDESASETTRKSAQQTLYTCLDHGLRLLHPFMPFVTEELWQRLPRRPNDPTPSIMLSKYPTFDKSSDFTDAERDFDLVFSAVKSSRALAASYNIQQNLHVYIRAESDAEAQLFQSQVPTFLALTKNCKSAEVVRDISGVPAGCGSEVLTPTIFVHVLVRGQVDIDGEINKCEKKLALARMNLSKVEKVESQAEYETTVPANVRLANEEKRKTLEADIKLLEHSIDMFTKLK
ncbi:tRNA synthetases class I-domain-containing protein [Fomes fomentarius]|nr:tRNA synthetases class I-domain-containing protein [Fomes fomentarius]